MSLLIIGLLLILQSTVDIRLENGLFRATGWSGAPRLDVYVDSNPGLTDVPPLSGQQSINGPELVFTPRYPLAAGVRYKAVLQIPGRDSVTRTFDMPKADLTPTTVVEHIYPTTTALPENQLKFYIHFSAPMGRGEAYRRIHLIDESGKRVEMPFLELEQELWDLPAQRLTLFFDPGRIKRDVLPNQEIGPSIVEGRRYTLVIDKEWRDAENKQLKGEFRKSFGVGPADRKPLDAASWKITAPGSGTTNSVLLDFPEPLDHALMLRQFEVVDAGGVVIPGTMQIERDETRWSFRPQSPWKSGNYNVRVGTIIADLAGNMLDRPFEIDVFDTVTERVVRETRLLPFSVK